MSEFDKKKLQADEPPQSIEEMYIALEKHRMHDAVLARCFTQARNLNLSDQDLMTTIAYFQAVRAEQVEEMMLNLARTSNRPLFITEP